MKSMNFKLQGMVLNDIFVGFLKIKGLMVKERRQT
jgi:hypothetical protein